MPRSVLPRNAVAALRRSSTAGMRHTARRRTSGTTRQARGRYSESPGWGPPVCCHLQPIGSQLAEVAAARGMEATWSLKVPAGTDIPVGSTWEVRGEDGCWTEMVDVTGDLVKHGRVMRLVGAKDTTLDKA